MIPYEVFISYAWGGESEQIVQELETALAFSNFTIVRDKRDLGFKGLISDFMKRIGHGKAVIAIISDKYLKSPYCMFELMELYRNRDFSDRIFPIVLGDASIFDPHSKLDYFVYWQEKKDKLGEKISELGPEAITVVGDDYKIYHKVLSNFGEVINILKDINSLSTTLHQASNFNEIHQALIQRFEHDKKKIK